MNFLNLNVIFLIFNFISSIISSENEYSLKSVTVFFRHGDRTPTGRGSKEWYPNDPYFNETYEPFGFGALTNEGKMREFALGTSLRKRYDKFLRKIYRPSDVEAYSTEYPRTIMSTQLVLAGLYPPVAEQVWNQGVNWQPIPVISAPKTIDPTLKPTKCPLYKEELARVKNSLDYKKDLSQFDKMFDDLTVITGKDIRNSDAAFNLFYLLKAQECAKFSLPAWSNDYYPFGSLRNATYFEYKTLSYTETLRKFTGGLPLHRVLNNMNKTMHGAREMPKMFLYGAHENNLAGLLISLGLWQPHIPEYSSAVILELHQKGSNYFVKILYYKGIPAEFENSMKLPKCSEYCPVEKFIQLNKHILPENTFETCFGSVINSKLIPQNENPVEYFYKKFSEWY